MNPKSFSVYLGLIFLLLGTNNLSAQQKFEFKMQKEKNFYSLKNYRLSPGGKYLLAQLSGSERDSLLVIDIINKKSIKLNGLHGAVQSYDLIPEQNLILVHTGEYSSSQTSLQCFIYDGLTLELKKVVLVGKAKQDTTKRNSSWLQPQDTGYQKLLGVEGNSMFFINHLSQVSKYNMLSGEGEILFTVNKQPDDFINSSISTIHKGILTSVIYDKQQKGKILWYNSNNKVQKLTDLPDGYTLSDFAVYQDSVKWYLAKKEKEQSLLIGLDISNGAVLFKENLSKYASKLAVSQQSGDLIFAHYGTGRLLKNVGKGTYKELDKDIEVGNSFLFSKSENSLIVADSYKLWKYNLSLSNEEFSIVRIRRLF